MRPSASSRSSRPLAPAAQASATRRSATAGRARTCRHTKAFGALLLVALTALPGCYLTHLARGQARLLWGRRPIAELLADPTTPAALREPLALSLEARSFAEALGLAVDGQYTSYVEWPGDRLVTTVVATRPGELEPVGFYFPIVGRVPYKGFFDPSRAEAEAERLRARGHDVCLVAVPAYSTLGWVDDPVTGPLARLGAGPLVETVLHELVHANVYVASEADFNEGVATFVGQEGALRFFAARAGAQSPLASAERSRIADERAVAAALGELRQAVTALYAGQPAGPARAARRAALEAATRTAVAALPLASRDPAELAAALRLNDACLTLSGTYERDLALYAKVLAALDGDLARFVTGLREAADAPDPRAALLALGGLDPGAAAPPAPQP